MRPSLVRLVSILAGAGLAALAGCLFVPVGYPTWSRTPEVHVNAPPEEVVAVLVRRVSGVTSIVTPTPNNGEIIGLLSLDGQRRLEPQNEMTWDLAVAGFLFVMPFFATSSSTVEVRLYRPGYETVTVSAWTDPKQIAWRPAAGIPGQMQALERINAKEISLPRDQQQLYCLFLSREYDRLAAAAAATPDGGKLQEVLTANAQSLVKKAKGVDNDLPTEKADEVKQAGHEEKAAK